MLPHYATAVMLLLTIIVVCPPSLSVKAWTCPDSPVVRMSAMHIRRTRTNLSASRRTDAPVAIKDELGCSPTLSLLLNQSFFFDPLNLATDDNFATYREAELKHGRVAMVSVLSSVTSTVFNEIFQVKQEGKTQQLWKSLLSPVATSPENAPADAKEVVVTIPINPQQLLPVPSPLALLHDWTVWDYVRMIVVCGIIEGFVWIQSDPQAMPGDYGVGYWGVRDKGLHERSLICELENGRLAMMVMLFYFALDLWHNIQPILIQQLTTAAEMEG